MPSWTLAWCAPTKGSIVFAILSGVTDGGVNIPHDEAKIVKERTKGEHIAKYAKSLGPENYAGKFSKYSVTGNFSGKTS